MKTFEAGPLHRNTPCTFRSADRITKALAEVYIEFFLIHPFRRGNARTGRLLVTLMAAQAGLPLLDFKDVGAGKTARYKRALDDGLRGAIQSHGRAIRIDPAEVAERQAPSIINAPSAAFRAQS